MIVLSREQILGIADLTIEFLEVPEWGGVVGVRVMTGSELHVFTERILATPEGTTFNQRAYVCALTLCDADGGRLFSQDDVEALERKSSRVIDRLYEVACRLNLLRESDREEAKKNASAILPDASGSLLPGSLVDAA